MNCTMKSDGTELVIRFENGCTVSQRREGRVETWAVGKQRIYQGPSVAEACRVAILLGRCYTFWSGTVRDSYYGIVRASSKEVAMRYGQELYGPQTDIDEDLGTVGDIVQEDRLDVATIPFIG